MRFARWITPALALAVLACAPGPAQAQDAQPRIIAGSDVPISTYPFQVSLRQQPAIDDGVICGGSIRDETHIITAAHCVTAGVLNEPVPASAFTVGYGSDSRASQSLVGVSTVSVPAEYRFPTLNESYDAAVLTLSAPIDLSGPNAKAIPFVNPAQPEDAGSGIVTGWGDTSEGGDVTETLKGTRVALRGDPPCVSYYGSEYVSSRAVCAGGGALPDGSNPDTCQGDSGGPLVVDLDNTAGTSFALLGLTSFGEGCGRQNVPAAYTHTHGAGIDSFLNASTFQTTTVTGGNFESGTPGARVIAQPAAVSQAPAAAPVAALRDTRRPTARLSSLSCTRRRRCTFGIRASDIGGRVAKLSATVRRRVRTCRGRGDARVCRTGLRKRTLKPRRVSGGFVLRATLARATYRLTAVATDAADNRSRTLTKTFRVRR